MFFILLSMKFLLVFQQNVTGTFAAASYVRLPPLSGHLNCQALSIVWPPPPWPPPLSGFSTVSPPPLFHLSKAISNVRIYLLSGHLGHLHCQASITTTHVQR